MESLVPAEICHASVREARIGAGSREVINDINHLFY